VHPAAAVFRSDGGHLFLFLMFAIKSRGTLIPASFPAQFINKKKPAIYQNAVGSPVRSSALFGIAYLSLFFLFLSILRMTTIFLLLLKLEMVWLLEV
jgi:hypothetical protein